MSEEACLIAKTVSKEPVTNAEAVLPLGQDILRCGADKRITPARKI